ncbi:unnamed protein product [Gongylonema pulchrum]|uniref:BZIP domain-containing protein n=1 Tax=Gongylonema pulchrum TaxID=637853 RepID=A0A183DFV9_9BILA|nr:unnamed protein product [Gongylonema pulchrum]
MAHAPDQPSSSASAVQSKPSVEANENQHVKSSSVEGEAKSAKEKLERKHVENELTRENEEMRKELERRNLGKQMVEAQVCGNSFYLAVKTPVL